VEVTSAAAILEIEANIGSIVRDAIAVAGLAGIHDLNGRATAMACHGI
jgi:hypothetical protein